jgi:hypothetical protein
MSQLTMDPPQLLEFFSWWYEDSHRQHLWLCYDLTTKHMRVKINDSEQDHLLARVLTATGKEVEVSVK